MQQEIVSRRISSLRWINVLVIKIKLLSMKRVNEPCHIRTNSFVHGICIMISWLRRRIVLEYITDHMLFIVGDIENILFTLITLMYYTWYYVYVIAKDSMFLLPCLFYSQYNFTNYTVKNWTENQEIFLWERRHIMTMLIFSIC